MTWWSNSQRTNWNNNTLFAATDYGVVKQGLIVTGNQKQGSNLTKPNDGCHSVSKGNVFVNVALIILVEIGYILPHKTSGNINIKTGWSLPVSRLSIMHAPHSTQTEPKMNFDVGIKTPKHDNSGLPFRRRGYSGKTTAIPWLPMPRRCCINRDDNRIDCVR